MVEVRKCKKCGKERPICDFSYSFKSKGWRRHECRECERKRMNEYYRGNDAVIKQRAAKAYELKPWSGWSEARRAIVRDRQKVEKQSRRRRVIDHYGGKCECCGETILQFLTMDHTNGGGSKMAREVHGRGTRFYKWIEANGYPADLRCLCYNCNCGRQHNGGICPHKVKEGSTTTASAGTPQAGWKRPGPPKRSKVVVI